MASYKILFRPSKNAGKVSNLLIRVIHRRKVLHLTTDIKLFREEWSDLESYLSSEPGTEVPIGMERTVAELNSILAHLEMLEKKLEAEGDFTASDLLSLYKLTNRGDSFVTFLGVLVRNLNAAGQERTARSYLSTLARLRRFVGGLDFRFQAIDCFFVKAFEAEMREEGLMQNTVSYYLRNLRAIYNKGLLSGLLPGQEGSPFQSVRIFTQITKKRALSLDQMRQFNNLDFSTFLVDDNIAEALISEGQRLRENLYKAWRLFLFSFHARGMSFVDIAYLRKENLRGNTLSYYRRKTGGFIEVKVNMEMHKIIMSFNDDVKGSKYVFPIILPIEKSERMQYESGLRLQNIRLKHISMLLGLKQPLSTHCARHSWATIAKRENLPLEIISEGLGHSDIRTTSVYLDAFERNALDRASDRVSTAIKFGLDT